MTLNLTPLLGIPLIHPGDDLAQIILKSLNHTNLNLQDGDVLVMAQKIVSKAEGRIINLTTVTPSPEAVKIATITEKDPRLLELMLRESKTIMRAQPGVVIVEHRLGFVCANAGIDHSNVGWGVDSYQGKIEGHREDPPDEWVLLLPENPDASAQAIRHRLEQASGVHLGVMVIDSHGRAWRMGAVGVAIGLAGLPGLVDLRGQSDLFGYKLRFTQVGAADELAAAASLVMGQTAESTPVVHVRGFPYKLREASFKELLRPKGLDLFR